MQENKIRLLIVDDEADICTTLKHYLSTRGYDVVVAESGAEALRILATEKIEVVLLDILIPDINGDVIAKAIKEYYPHIKIIIQSGYPDAAELIGRLLPIDDFCLKPCKIDEVYTKLEHVQEKKTPQEH